MPVYNGYNVSLDFSPHSGLFYKKCLSNSLQFVADLARDTSMDNRIMPIDIEYIYI
jgi:hypothetical protein